MHTKSTGSFRDWPSRNPMLPEWCIAPFAFVRISYHIRHRITIAKMAYFLHPDSHPWCFLVCRKGCIFIQKNTPTHLTAHDRNITALMITSECPTRAIASALVKSPSTISREIKNHTQTVFHKNCDRIYFKECRIRHICGSTSCNKLCKSCQHARKKCSDYVKAECEQLSINRHHLCNSCLNQKNYHLEKRFYDAEKAQKEYEKTLKESRQGYNLTGEELEKINDIVSPAIKQGLSVYHIKQTYGSVIPASET